MNKEDYVKPVPEAEWKDEYVLYNQEATERLVYRKDQIKSVHKLLPINPMPQDVFEKMGGTGEQINGYAVDIKDGEEPVSREKI